MCGIVGAVSQRDIVPTLIEGLRRLEYRGYDSCGVAVHRNGAPRRARSMARVNALARTAADMQLEGLTGIAHTRWATHGLPAMQNAHPIFSRELIAVVHNGIIENHEPLRTMLIGRGYEFVSQTDTEVVAHLIHAFYHGDLLAAVRAATALLHGSYAIAVFSNDEPQRMVGARQGSPLVVGIGAEESFLASDVLALEGSTDRFIFLEDGDSADLTPSGVRICDRDGNHVRRPERSVVQPRAEGSLGEYRHYMQKEIFEQPDAVAQTIAEAEPLSTLLFKARSRDAFDAIDNVLLLGCGTSHYSGQVAKHWFESIARLPVQVEIASEYRYRQPVESSRTLVVVISQSGETADTLAALKHAQALGHEHTLAICNVAASAMMRATKWSFLTKAGREIGVASTKAFTTQLAALFVLAATLGRIRGVVTAEQETRYRLQLDELPAALRAVLALEPQVIAWANELAMCEHVLFLGRGPHLAIALEGALKLKEISYIHAEAFPAGELKHGPLALVTSAMPVVVCAPNDGLVDKLKSNMEEVRARGGRLYVIADVGTHIEPGESMSVIELPPYFGPLSSLLHVLPLQLLAYHAACIRGTDVDKPRNLAKSVTVD
jgi:glucosamine--fructose-6-phosphate aminotransferase (isomerizing)